MDSGCPPGAGYLPREGAQARRLSLSPAAAPERLDVRYLTNGYQSDWVKDCAVCAGRLPV
jgi:hypothetical protein